MTNILNNPDITGEQLRKIGNLYANFDQQDDPERIILHIEYKKAAQWFKKAEEKGDAKASYHLGTLYLSKNRRDKYLEKISFIQAAMSYQRAADRDVTLEADVARELTWIRDESHIKAQDLSEIGWRYMKDPEPANNDINQNYQTAVMWLKKAVEKGSAMACRNLGWLYENGYGVQAIDLVIAAYYYQLAIDRGYEQAKISLSGIFYHRAITPAEKYNISVMYHDGQCQIGDQSFPLAKDYEKAKLWQKKAAEANTSVGNLGRAIILPRITLSIWIPKHKYRSFVWDTGNKNFFENFGALRSYIINREGHAAITFPFSPEFTSVTEYRNSHPDLSSYQKELLYVSFMGGEERVIFSQRLSDFVRYANSENHVLKTYELFLSERELTLVGQMFLKKLDPDMEHRHVLNQNPPQLQIIDIEASTVRDMTVEERHMYIPKISENRTVQFSTIASPFFQWPQQFLGQRNIENCTSVVVKLLESSNHPTNFLGCGGISALYGLIVFEGGLAGYNVGNIVSLFVSNNKQEKADDFVSFIALSLLVVQIIWILLNPMLRFRWINYFNKHRYLSHFGLFLLQFIITSISLAIEFSTEKTKKAFSKIDENALLIGLGAGAFVGFLHILIPALQLGFFTVYRPVTLNQLMQEEARKEPRDRYVDKKDPLEMLTWMSAGKGYVRKTIPIDGDCGYNMLGINRATILNELLQRVNDNDNQVIELILIAVREALIGENGHSPFLVSLQNNEMKTGIDDEPILRQQAGNEQLQNILLQGNQGLETIRSYLEYDIRDKNIDHGWAHPAIWQAIALVRQFNLHLWQINEDDGKLIIYERDNRYQPDLVGSLTANHPRYHMLFTQKNHFDSVILMGYTEGTVPTSPIPIARSYMSEKPELESALPGRNTFALFYRRDEEYNTLIDSMEAGRREVELSGFDL